MCCLLLVVPVSRIEMTHEIHGAQKTALPTRKKHVLSDEQGRYPVGKLGGWEASVLDTEIGSTTPLRGTGIRRQLKPQSADRVGGFRPARSEE